MKRKKVAALLLCVVFGMSTGVGGYVLGHNQQAKSQNAVTKSIGTGSK